MSAEPDPVTAMPGDHVALPSGNGGGPGSRPGLPSGNGSGGRHMAAPGGGATPPGAVGAGQPGGGPVAADAGAVGHPGERPDRLPGAARADRAASAYGQPGPPPPPPGPRIGSPNGSAPGVARDRPTVASSGPVPAPPVTLLSGRTDVRDWLAHVVGQSVEVRLQQWQSGAHPRAVEAIADEVAADGTGVLCIGDDVPLELAFAVAAQIDQRYAHVTVLLLAAAWPEVWREALRSGVRDVVDPSRGEAEVGPALHRALQRAMHLNDLRSAATAPEPSKARVIVVLSAKGGSGKTVVASNLAAALAQAADGPVALVDLDVQFGDAASALGLVPEHTIAGLAMVPDIDSTTLKVFLTQHEASGAFVLCGAASPEEGDVVTDKHAGRVVELLSRDFACVVVDTPAGIDERTLAALDHATDAVLVATMDVASIRNLGKEIHALDRADLMPPNRHFVLNRADARVGIEVTDVRAALGMDVDASIPSSRAVPLAMNQGRPFVVDDPASTASREIVRLAGRFVDGAEPTGELSHGQQAAPAAQGKADSNSWLRRRRTQK